jgi:hypothetical protein
MMNESEQPEHVSTLKRVSGITRKAAKVFIVLAGIGLLINIVSVQIPKLLTQIGDLISAAIPDIARNFLLWFSTDPTLAKINAWAAEWSGLLTILGIALAIVFYLSSLGDRSNTKSKGGKG